MVLKPLCSVSLSTRNLWRHWEIAVLWAFVHRKGEEVFLLSGCPCCLPPMSVLVCSCLCVFLRPYLIAGISAFSQEHREVSLLLSSWLPPSSFPPAQLLSASSLLKLDLASQMPFADFGAGLVIPSFSRASSYALGFPWPTPLNAFTLITLQDRVIFA